MNDLERFKAVVRFEKPDFYPLILTLGQFAVTKGGIEKLHREGLPEWVNDNESWARYWGQCPLHIARHIGVGEPELRVETWVEGEFEYSRSETGALTRRARNHETAYSMPEFIEFDVRDRASWEKFKQFSSTHASPAKLDEQVKKFSGRTRPLAVAAGGTWGHVRNLMGPERALTALYDDPDLVRDMIAFSLWQIEQFVFPVIEALRPEVVMLWEDFCYNHGLMISPKAFREFCAPYYRRVAEGAKACGVELLIVDCDGKVDEFCLLLDEVGFNGIWPLEQVCGNPVAEYRKRQPRFIFSGGIEKEIANTGQGRRIEAELAKLPVLLKQGGYLPTFDHALQPLVGFSELCRAMTLLHDICGSEGLGEFSRVRKTTLE